MRHVKSILEYYNEEEKLYREMDDGDEYFSCLEEIGLLFADPEVKKLYNFITKYTTDFDFQPTWIGFTVKSFKTSKQIQITKTKDEWFYFSYGDKDDVNVRFFKCDQFRGLMDCLKFLSSAWITIDYEREILYKEIINFAIKLFYNYDKLAREKLSKMSVEDLKKLEEMFKKLYELK